MKTKETPLVFTVDDDPEINNLLRVWLRDVECKIVNFNSAEEFLLKFRSMKPDLCIIDINIGGAGVGFKIVEAIRKVFGEKPPIIIFSGDKDSRGIAHGIDLGADDYIIKPSSKTTLVDKVESFLEINSFDDRILIKGIPESQKRIKILVDFFIDEIDEFGVKIRGNKLLSKGSSVVLDSPVLKEIYKKNDNIYGTVVSNWINTTEDSTGAFIEFSDEDKSILDEVKRWISINLTKQE